MIIIMFEYNNRETRISGRLCRRCFIFEFVTEVITLTKIGVFDKKSILFNRNAFYEPLKKMFETMEKVGFLSSESMKHVLFSDEIKEIEKFLRSEY